MNNEYEIRYKVNHRGEYVLVDINPSSNYWESMFDSITTNLRDVGEGTYIACLVETDEYTGEYEIEEILYNGGWRNI